MKKEIIIILIDKGLLALILVGVAIFVNGTLEKLKSEQNFSQQINEKRIEKLAEAWGFLNKIELGGENIIKLQDYIQGTEQLMARESSRERSIRLVESINKTHSDISVLSRIQDSIAQQSILFINENRFWLGEKRRKTMLNFVSLNRQYYGSLLLPDVDEFENVDWKMKLDSARTDIVKARDNLFDE